MPDTFHLKKSDLIAQFPQITREYLENEIDKTKYLGGGSFGRAFQIDISDGRRLVLKSYRVKGMNKMEAEQLKILSDNTDVQMPKVLFLYDNENVSLMCMTLIEGKNVLNPLFLLKSKKQKEKFASEVVSGMMSWHKVKNDRFGPVEAPLYSSWKKYYKEQKEDKILIGIGKLAEQGKFSRKKYEILTKASEYFEKNIEDASEAVLIHGDLNIMNIMADTKNFSLTGFIDPNSSMWGDREYDLYQLENMWGNKFGLYETYKKTYGRLSRDADFKEAYYGTMNEVSCRLSGGTVFPIWEDLWFERLKKEMKKIN